MKDKNLEDISESNLELTENDIINDDILAMSNLTNMVSLSSIYMAPGIAVSSTDVLSDVDEDNKRIKE